MKFENPANGHIVYKSSPALWCFLFGALYFLVSGIWRHALVMFIISVALLVSLGVSAILLVIAMQTVYCFFADSIVFSHYFSRGWGFIME